MRLSVSETAPEPIQISARKVLAIIRKTREVLVHISQEVLH